MVESNKIDIIRLRKKGVNCTKQWNHTAFKKGFVFLFLSCFLLAACTVKSEEATGEIDIKGNVVEVDGAQNSILIEDKQKGLIWVKLHENGDIKDYEVGQEVAVWVGSEVDDSSSASEKTLNIEIINSR